MKYLRLYWLVFIVLPFIIINCKENEDTINIPIDLLIDTYDNIPVIVNTENSYTFTVSASNLTYSIEDNLVFLSDSLVVTITLTNVSSANSRIKLFSENNEEIFSESLNNNKVFVNTELKGNIPKTISIELDNFSGQLTIVVATDKS
jgi:hypothetical protein